MVGTAGAASDAVLEETPSSSPTPAQTTNQTAGNTTLGVGKYGVCICLPPSYTFPGETDRSYIFLENGTAGVAGYNVTVELTNETVASVVDARVSQDGGLPVDGGSQNRTEDVRIDITDDSVTISANYTDALNGSEASPSDAIILGPVTVEADANGTTELEVNRSAEVRTANDGTYDIDGFESTLFTVDCLKASTDDDPQVEDVTGDGSADVFDAIALYNEVG